MNNINLYVTGIVPKVFHSIRANFRDKSC